MGYWKRLASSGTDPWLGLVSVVGGGLAWAISVPNGLPVAIAAGMWGIGAAVGAALNREDESPYALEEEKQPKIPLRSGTEQAKAVEALAAYVKDLRTLRGSGLPEGVVDSAIAALVAAEGAQLTARRVAAAIDGLDTALERSRGGPGQGVREAVVRMGQRRQALMGTLHATVDGVAEVYTKLLETSATVSSLDVGDDALTEVASVNASLDALRSSLAELESADRSAPA